MKAFISTVTALGAALALGACASDYGGGGARYAGGYDTYYDDGYGPYYGGYWGPDDVFLFSRERGGPMVRDDAHHFRHDRMNGFHGVRANPALARSATAPDTAAPAAATAPEPRPRS
jgi:hypothetical protein